MSILEEIFRQTAFNHFFELKVAELHKAGKIKIPIYLSVGQEFIPSSIYYANPNWIVFTQHRCHSYYLSFGGDPKALLKELLGKQDGCNGGMGGSASISIKDKIFGHDGLLGSNLPIAAGFAHASNKPTLVQVGDAAIEEDYSIATLGYAVSKKLPLLIICEDNDLSICTKKSTRRDWSAVQVAKGFGMYAKNILDDPMEIYETVKSCELPALININTCRHLWHAGSGTDGPPAWNIYETVKKTLEFDDESIKQEVEQLCLEIL